MDRHVILVPQDIIPDFEDRQAVNPGTLKFEEILKAIYNSHKSGPVTYAFDESAREEYAKFYNEIAQRAREARDKEEDDIKGALMKSQV
jgi:hypothetical protein